MVRLRGLATPFVVFLLIIMFGSSILVHHSSEGFRVINNGEAVKNHPVNDEESHGKWERKTWMNHGSSRGPRKHLVNPTLHHAFQANQLLL